MRTVHHGPTPRPIKRDGLIQRTPNPNDGRRSSSPSRHSRFANPTSPKILLDGSRVSLAGFSDREKAMLTHLLKRIVQNLEQELGEDPRHSQS